MTPSIRQACLALLRWSQRGLAEALGYDESTVRVWMRGGGKPPPEVDAWLEKLAAFHERHPPPGP